MLELNALISRALSHVTSCELTNDELEYGKYTLAKFANFVYFCITHGKALPQNGGNSPEVVRLFCA